VFPVRYEVDFYIICRRNSVFKGLIKHHEMKKYGRVEPDLHAVLILILDSSEWSALTPPEEQEPPMPTGQ
jgi:hypothetical protein